MKIAILLGTWTIGSLLLGLVVGRLFNVFAARRHAEEELFARAEEMHNLAAPRGGAASYPKPVCPALGVPNTTSVPVLRGTGWFFHRPTQQRRRVQ
ncbi:MAG TPA: hypothetical protein VG206_13195 [Terriglobia bacterium]|nr:hypothetical protein [Terriglobia bacterium]